MEEKTITGKIAAQWPEISWLSLMALAWLYTNLLGSYPKLSLFGIFSILCGIAGFILGILYFLDALPDMPERRRCKWLAAVLMSGCVFNIFMPVM